MEGQATGGADAGTNANGELSALTQVGVSSGNGAVVDTENTSAVGDVNVIKTSADAGTLESDAAFGG